MAIDRNKKRSPPYVSYRSFITLLEELQRGVPARIDRSYWGDKFSGSTGTQLISALRFLNLVDASGVPTNQLRELAVARSTQRSEIFNRVCRESFIFLASSSFDLKTATYAQLDEIFREFYQVDRDVARKCIKFFIEMAEDSEIPLSEFITKRSKKVHSAPVMEKIPKRNGNRTNRNLEIPNSMELIPKPVTWQELVLQKFPTFDPAWSPDVQLRWFEAFDELLKRGFLQGMAK